MKSDRVYLLHIRDAIDRIHVYTAGGKDAFFATPMRQDAVVRNLEIIGEAVKNLSDALKAMHQEIPWKRIAGMRDKLIHEYFGVNLELVWDIVADELPELKRCVESMLQESQGSTG